MCGPCQIIWVSPGSPSHAAMKHFSYLPHSHKTRFKAAGLPSWLHAVCLHSSPQPTERGREGFRKDRMTCQKRKPVLKPSSPNAHGSGRLTKASWRHHWLGWLVRCQICFFPSKLSFLLRTLFCIAASFPFQGFCIYPFPNLLFPLTFQNIIRIHVLWQLLFYILTTESSCKPSPKLITFDIITILGNVFASCGNVIFFIKKKKKSCHSAL